jgi:hypothetical protein
MWQALSGLFFPERRSAQHLMFVNMHPATTAPPALHPSTAGPFVLNLLVLFAPRTTVLITIRWPCCITLVVCSWVGRFAYTLPPDPSDLPWSTPCDDVTLQVTPLLAERYFGSALELTSHDNYCPFWASDAQDPNNRPAGSEDGESVVQVSQRVHQLFQVCEEPDT